MIIIVQSGIQASAPLLFVSFLTSYKSQMFCTRVERRCILLGPRLTEPRKKITILVSALEARSSGLIDHVIWIADTSVFPRATNTRAGP